MQIFTTIEKELTKHNLKIDSYDHTRPWGGFFVIQEEDAQRFSNIYFDGFDVDTLRKAGKLKSKNTSGKTSGKIILAIPSQKSRVLACC